MRLVPGAGFLPSGNEHNLRVDADAASFVFANWPTEVDWVGIQTSINVITGPSLTSEPAKDPVKRAYDLFSSTDRTPAFGQLPLLFAARGLGTNFAISGFDGMTIVSDFTQPIPGQDNWFPTPTAGQSFLSKAGTASNLEIIINSLVQSSSNLPIVRSISPGSFTVGIAPPLITVKGTNFFPDSVALIGGSLRATTFLNSTQLNVQLLDHDVSHPGVRNLTVLNAKEDGWLSADFLFRVFNNK